MFGWDEIRYCSRWKYCLYRKFCERKTPLEKKSQPASARCFRGADTGISDLLRLIEAEAKAKVEAEAEADRWIEAGARGLGVLAGRAAG